MEPLLCRLVVAVIPLVALLGTIVVVETLRRHRQLRTIQLLRRAQRGKLEFREKTINIS